MIIFLQKKDAEESSEVELFLDDYDSDDSRDTYVDTKETDYVQNELTKTYSENDVHVSNEELN